jgi:hypothetical protein
LATRELWARQVSINLRFRPTKRFQIQPKMEISPVKFPVTRENAARDGFWPNWQHRHILLSHS